MMRSDIQKTITQYVQLYEALYDRQLKDVRIIDGEFILVNNTQIRLGDLKQLTQQLQQEYDAKRRQERKKRSTIQRLINFFRSA